MAGAITLISVKLHYLLKKMEKIPYNERHYRCLRNLLISLNRDLLYISRFMDSKDEHSDYDDIEYYVMALEDRRYLRHCGVDFKSFLRELLKIIRGKKHGGASTIDMQLIRTITGFKDPTIFRKSYESILAFLINFKFTKKQIIRCYLKNAFFGSGLIGIESAAQSVFKKNVIDLNKHEKAFIAAMLLRPKPLKANEEWFCLVWNRAAYSESVRPFVKKSHY